MTEEDLVDGSFPEVRERLKEDYQRILDINGLKWHEIIQGEESHWTFGLYYALGPGTSDLRLAVQENYNSRAGLTRGYPLDLDGKLILDDLEEPARTHAKAWESKQSDTLTTLWLDTALPLVTGKWGPCPRDLVTPREKLLNNARCWAVAVESQGYRRTLAITLIRQGLRLTPEQLRDALDDIEQLPREDSHALSKT
jgi:hypothetical protein